MVCMRLHASIGVGKHLGLESKEAKERLQVKAEPELERRFGWH